MAVWTFVRHGQSEANAEGWFAGHADAPLTALGRQQARDARPALARLRPLPRLFSSDLSRAHQTAQILLEDAHEGPQPELTVTAALRERSCGLWERRPIAELEHVDGLAILETWDGRPPGGESLRDLALRVLPFLASIDDGTDVLLVCHGALMRCVIGLVDGRPREQIGHWKPFNCEFVRRDLPRGTWAATLDAVLL